jgi:hypothetical protein
VKFWLRAFLHINALFLILISSGYLWYRVLIGAVEILKNESRNPPAVLQTEKLTAGIGADGNLPGCRAVFPMPQVP